MKIVLTGASGFLGSALTHHWLAQGHDLSLLLRPTSDLRRLHGVADDVSVCRFATDADIAAHIDRLQPDAVVHTACSYGRQGEGLPQIVDANVRFGAAILEALKRGARPAVFINTGTALAPSVGPYALTKHQFADLGQLVAQASGGALQFVNVALQHMIGPGDDPSKFPMAVIHACHRNDAELRLTAGEQQRDFIYIDDVQTAYSTLLDRHRELGPSTHIEVGSGQAPTIRTFADTVHRLTRSTTQLAFGAVAYRPNEAMLCRADLSQMRALGWTPRYDLEAAIQRTIELEFKP